MNRKITRIAGITSLLYWLFAAAWIFVSDIVVGYVAVDISQLQRFELLKGLAFITATTAIIYLALRSQLKKYEKSQDALIESEKNLKTLIRSLPDLVWFKDPQGVYVACNPRFERLFGAQENDIVGKTDYDFVNRGLADFFRKHDQLAETMRKPSINEETVTFADDGHEEILETIKTPIFASDGQLIGVLGIGRDITERKKAADAVEEALLRQNEAVRAASVGLWDWDLVTDKVRYSGEWKRQLGYDEHEISDDVEEWKKRVHPDDLPTTLAKIETAIERIENDYSVEFRLRHKNGSYRWILAQASVFGDANHCPLRVLGSNIDITERKETEYALRRSEELLRISQRISKVGGWEWDLVRREMFWTEETYRIHDFDPSERDFTSQEFIDRSVACYDPEDRQRILSAINRCVEKAEPYSLECRFTTAKGRRLWIKTEGMAIREDGQIVKVLGNIQDITEQKHAMLELKRTSDVIEHAINGFDIVDSEGKFVYVNKAYARMWGYDDPREIIGTSPADHCQDPSTPATIISTLKRQGRCEIEFTARRKDDSTFDVLMHAMLMHDDRGNELYAGTSVDISERKRAEQERKELQDKLIQAQKMESIGTLAGGIAHDFNNILSSVIGYTELAQEDVEKGSEIEAFLQEIYGAGQRARDLVGQILTFARQSEDKLEPVPLNSIVKEVVKFLRASIPATIEIQQKIESKAIVLANPTKVHQILMNLCTNAAHAMEKDGGTLEVVLRDFTLDAPDVRQRLDLEYGEYLELRVSDTGVGIAPDIIESIFDPYFTTKGKAEGTGLGLAVVHGIVESYGGRIKVLSRPGAGTTFTIYLPTIPKYESERPAIEQRMPTGRERILLVDDEAPIANIGSQMLERLGYSVTIRTSSIEALALFRASPDAFDLVITDMTMPHMAGDRFAKELLAVRSDIPIVVCTGFSERIDEVKSEAIGIKGLLMKPVAKSDLAVTVRHVLDGAGGGKQ